MHHPDGLVEPGGMTWKKLTTRGTAPLPVSPAVAGQWAGDSSRWPLEKKLRSFNSTFRAQVETVLEKLRSRGFQPKLFYAWRSVAVQLELFNKGNSKVRFSFHNAQLPDGTPNSYAADIVDERWGWGVEAERNGFWKALGEEANKLGVVWGGDWTNFKDVAHIQGRRNSELVAVKRESGL